MNTINTIAKRWAAVEKKMLGNNISPIGREVFKQVFYAGAFEIFILMYGDEESQNYEDWKAKMEVYSAELEQFAIQQLNDIHESH